MVLRSENVISDLPGKFNLRIKVMSDLNITAETLQNDKIQIHLTNKIKYYSFYPLLIQLLQNLVHCVKSLYTSRIRLSCVRMKLKSN